MTKIYPQQTRQTRIKMEIYADCFQFGGWQPFSKTFEPIRFQEAIATYGRGTQTQYVLDCISLAVEAHFFTTRESLKASIFASEDDFNTFCECLSQFDWWLNERHAYAFAMLLDCEEFTIRTYAELAAEFRDEYAQYPMQAAS